MYVTNTTSFYLERRRRNDDDDDDDDGRMVRMHAIWGGHTQCYIGLGPIGSLGAYLQETGDPNFLAKQKARVKVAKPHTSPGVPLNLHSRHKKEWWMDGWWRKKDDDDDDDDDEGRMMMMVMKEWLMILMKEE